MRSQFLRWSIAIVALAVVGLGDRHRAPAEGTDAVELRALETMLSSVTVDDLKRHIEFLADDTLEGREAGSRGGQSAGHYLGEQFQRHALAGGGTAGGYYQSFGANYRNLLGVWEGSDPVLRDEIVLVGAHYDHVGYGTSQNSYGPTGYIHNGADDNASGTATLVEMVEAFATAGQRPPRTLVFALWDAEEKGLLGSKHWVDHPTLPLERVRLAFNMDMLGRLANQKVTIYGSRTAAGLRAYVARRNAGLLTLDFSWELSPDSDHYSFYERGIPFVMPFTGLHGDYHRPSDDVERLNSEGLRQLAQMVTALVWDAAWAPSLSPFRADCRRETQTTQRRVERPLAPQPGRLGVQFDATIVDAPPRVTRVLSDSPAARAGLLADDVIHQVAGRDVRNVADFQRLVLAASSPIKLQLGREAQVNRPELLVESKVGPTRWGLTWRYDQAEPGVLIVQRVIPGTPAAAAGIAVLDRVMTLDGQSFGSGEALAAALRASNAAVTIEYERQGRIVQLTIEPLPAVDGQGLDLQQAWRAAPDASRESLESPVQPPDMP